MCRRVLLVTLPGRVVQKEKNSRTPCTVYSLSPCHVGRVPPSWSAPTQRPPSTCPAAVRHSAGLFRREKLLLVPPRWSRVHQLATCTPPIFATSRCVPLAGPFSERESPKENTALLDSLQRGAAQTCKVTPWFGPAPSLLFVILAVPLCRPFGCPEQPVSCHLAVLPCANRLAYTASVLLVAA